MEALYKIGFVSVLIFAALSSSLLTMHLYNDRQAKIAALEADNEEIASSKVKAVYAYLDGRGLVFEDDDKFSVKERLDILQDRGVIKSVEERIRIDHDLSGIESEAIAKLNRNFNAKLMLIVQPPVFVLPVLLGVGISLGIGLPILHYGWRVEDEVARRHRLSNI